MRKKLSFHRSRMRPNPSHYDVQIITYKLLRLYKTEYTIRTLWPNLLIILTSPFKLTIVIPNTTTIFGHEFFQTLGRCI